MRERSVPGKVWRTTIVSSSGATNVSATRVTLPNTLVVIDRATSGSNVWLQRSGAPQRFPSTDTLSAKRPKLNASTCIPCGEWKPCPPKRLPTTKMPRVMPYLRLRSPSDGTPPRKSAVMQRLPFDSITGTYPVGSSAPIPHTVRPPSAATAQTAAITIILNVTMHRFILNHLVHDCLRQRRFGRRLCLSLTATITVHTSLLRRLQSAHSIWQFSATVLPPFAQGVMWSACISSMAKCFPHFGHLPPCRV